MVYLFPAHGTVTDGRWFDMGMKYSVEKSISFIDALATKFPGLLCLRMARLQKTFNPQQRVSP